MELFVESMSVVHKNPEFNGNMNVAAEIPCWGRFLHERQGTSKRGSAKGKQAFAELCPPRVHHIRQPPYPS